MFRQSGVGAPMGLTLGPPAPILCHNFGMCVFSFIKFSLRKRKKKKGLSNVFFNTISLKIALSNGPYKNKRFFSLFIFFF